MHYLELEKEYAEFIGTSHCVTVNTGTAALHVALEALELPEGSKVLVPDFTMYASALAVHYARLEPVFVDCDENLLMDLDKAEELIDEDTKVLMVTHIYGRTLDMKRVMKISNKYNLRVIEDACEAQGASQHGKMIGSFDIGCFSFYTNKIIHGEEGGAITTNDEALAEKIIDMKSMSFGKTHNYYHERIGFNYRMTNSQAEMILSSLRECKSNLIRRQEIADIFNSLFPRKYQMPNNRDVVWVYDLIHPNAEELVKILKENSINARHSFKPMSSMPLFSSHKIGKMSEKKSKEVFYLHIDPKWVDEDVQSVFERTLKIMEEV